MNKATKTFLILFILSLISSLFIYDYANRMDRLSEYRYKCFCDEQKRSHSLFIEILKLEEQMFKTKKEVTQWKGYWNRENSRVISQNREINGLNSEIEQLRKYGQ